MMIYQVVMTCVRCVELGVVRLFFSLHVLCLYATLL